MIIMSTLRNLVGIVGVFRVGVREGKLVVVTKVIGNATCISRTNVEVMVHEGGGGVSLCSSHTIEAFVFRENDLFSRLRRIESDHRPTNLEVRCLLDNGIRVWNKEQP